MRLETTDCIEKGGEYENLQNGYVIFITNFDPCNQDRCVYCFEYCEEKDPALKLNDGSVKLFFNTKGKDDIDPMLRKLLSFFDENDHLPEKTSDDPFLQKLIDEFYKIKENREMEVSFMTQAVHDRDMRMEGFEDAEAVFKPMLKEKDQQLAEKDDMIADQELIIAALKAALSDDALEEVLLKLKAQSL